MLYYLFSLLYVLSCFLLLLVVLLQQGKGGDMASAFGGGGSQTAFGARTGATVLTKATAVLGVLFMVGAIALGVMGQRGGGTLMRGLAPAAAPTPPPVQGMPVPAGQTSAPATTPAPSTAPAPNSTTAPAAQTPQAPAPEQPKK
jgi:preprotein translocase subunit SecG